jgi:uncharacterized protein (TIGR02646 family)
MRKLKRIHLSRRTQTFLQKRTIKITTKTGLSEKVEEAKNLWKAKSNKAFAEIKETLRKMASGLERCMYCEDSAGTDIEHFWPKDTYPDKAFLWENYLLACSACNSNFKRTQFPLKDGHPLLINPVEEEPRHHIGFSPSTGRYAELTDKGAESIRIYGLNRNILAEGRRLAWVSIQVHIIYYSQCRDNGDLEASQPIKEVICRFPHSSVFIELINLIDNPDAESWIYPDCIQTVRKYPEIRTWLKSE